MRARVTTFLRLWLVFAFSYAILSFVYDLIARGYIDVSLGPRGRELLLVPLFETAIFALLTAFLRVIRP